jgi:hypothetical protein
LHISGKIFFAMRRTINNHAPLSAFLERLQLLKLSPVWFRPRRVRDVAAKFMESAARPEYTVGKAAHEQLRQP